MNEASPVTPEPLDERLVRIGRKLQEIGMDYAGIAFLFKYDLDEIEKQLSYLPYRKSRRPAALLIEAVRRRYSPPKGIFYASHIAHAKRRHRALDEDPEPTH